MGHISLHPLGPLYSRGPGTSTNGKKNKMLRHENKNQGPRDPGNRTLETAFRSIRLHTTAEVFFQRKPKIENRQKSDGPLQWFNSSLFGGEYSVVGPSLRVPGAEAPGLISFTSKIVPRLGCTSAATANSRLHQRAEVSQSKTAISSHRSAGQLCAALCPG